ncbi:MAG: threonine synthase [Deltaproteobacteria bacterium]|nr:threonine synthase [Candidatus Anaeroferrophillus wilburensis]MBN2888209.1 threonine synthase [Deltaproteobacteria bacterium]
MNYISTRGGIAPISFVDAVMMGLAADGGLLLPEEIPVFSAGELEQLGKLSYQQLALRIFQPYVGDCLAADVLAELVKTSYATFTNPLVAPLVKKGDLYILELFHGQTLAFKDIALSLLGNLFARLLADRQQELNILGATSGDTGSAAIYGVRGKKHINIFILHPHGKVSPIQEKQMTSVLDDNVFNVAVEGTFDDGQRIVKEIFADLDFKREFHLGAVNSINWARIMAQIVYYFTAYLQLPAAAREVVDIVVPTGNFGNIFAGYLAKQMGLPIRRLILASNENNILSHFIASGVYERSQVVPTWSPSMDIQVASNFERYLYYLLDGDSAAICKVFAELQESGRIAIGNHRFARVQTDFASGYSSNEENIATIAEFYQQTGYILDPHTAVGVQVARKLNPPRTSDRVTTICLATAHPAKFPQAVEKAIGFPPPVPVSLQGIEQLPSRFAILPASTPIVKKYIKDQLLSPA